MRSLIVAHSVRSFFSASHPRIRLGTFSTASPEIFGGSLCPDGVDFNYQSTRVQLLRTDKALTEILEIDVVKRLWYLLCEDLIYDRHECRW